MVRERAGGSGWTRVCVRREATQMACTGVSAQGAQNPSERGTCSWGATSAARSQTGLWVALGGGATGRTNSPAVIP